MRSASWRLWLERLSRSLEKNGPGARPRQRRSRHRPELERLEDRTVPSVSIASSNNSGQGYAALDFNQSGGFTPPDTVGAAGPSSFVETVNQTIAIYSPKSNPTTILTDSLRGSGG